MAFIQFYYGKRIAFGSVDENISDLGGLEGSLLILPRGLAGRGHRIEVYNTCWAPDEYDGLQRKGDWEIDNAETPDVRISVRTADSVLKNDALVQIFWLLDDRPEGAMCFGKLYHDSPIVLASDTMADIILSKGICSRSICAKEKYHRKVDTVSTLLCLIGALQAADAIALNL